jgi:hypothetical protein
MKGDAKAKTLKQEEKLKDIIDRKWGVSLVVIFMIGKTGII